MVPLLCEAIEADEILGTISCPSSDYYSQLEKTAESAIALFRNMMLHEYGETYNTYMVDKKCKWSASHFSRFQ